MAIRPSIAAYRARVTSGFALALSLSNASCSLTVDAGRAQCHMDRDCMTGPSALAAGVCIDGLCDARSEWLCSGEAPSASAAGDVEVSLPIIDLLARQNGAELEASVCRKLDVSCDAPTQTMTMRATGELPLELEAGFDGYLSIRGADLVPTLYFLSPPLVSGERLPALTLIGRSSMAALALEMQVDLLADRGVGLFTVQDCEGAFAPGVEIEAQPADGVIMRFYDVDGLPSVAASLTGRTGSGGFMNAASGPLSVVARLPGSEAPLTAASVLVRPGFVSYGRLRPGGSLPDPYEQAF
jgi:hypothetical protein